MIPLRHVTGPGNSDWLLKRAGTVVACSILQSLLDMFHGCQQELTTQFTLHWLGEVVELYQEQL